MKSAKFLINTFPGNAVTQRWKFNALYSSERITQKQVSGLLNVPESLSIVWDTCVAVSALPDHLSGPTLGATLWPTGSLCRNTSADAPRQERPSGAEADRSGV